MTFSHAPWIVVSILGLTVIWLALVAYFFHYAQKHQPSQFELLGNPGFSVRGSSLRVITYIFKRSHRSLGDSRFSLLCDAMVVCFSMVIILFVLAFAIGGGPYHVDPPGS